MIPSPLHPAVIHFPVVLMLFLPLVGAAALFAIRRGVPAVRAWTIPLGLAALLAASSLVAVRTGEAEKERIEHRVPEAALETHEETAERFLLFSGIVVLVMAAGLMRGAAGRVGRVAGLTASLLLTVAGYQTGHSGGRLVYGDGVASGLVAGAGERAGEQEGERD